MPKEKNGLNYYQFHRHEMLELLPTHYSKVLEVGCGEGNFRSALSLENEYWGVEQNIDSANIAKQKLNNILIGDYDSVSSNIPNNYFDLIICNDVIEHMTDHVAFLLNIKQKLAANGSLVISIPNVRYMTNLNHLLFAKDWRYTDAGILDRTHLRFFTKKSLTQTLDETSWKVVKIKGINRYGSGSRRGAKQIRFALSYLAQLIYGRDSAYLQFAARLTDNHKANK